MDHFTKAARIWEAYFNRRKGGKGLSRTEREMLLDEMRKKIEFKQSDLNDAELIKKIEESRAKSLDSSIKNAFKS